MAILEFHNMSSYENEIAECFEYIVDSTLVSIEVNYYSIQFVFSGDIKTLLRFNKDALYCITGHSPVSFAPGILSNKLDGVGFEFIKLISEKVMSLSYKKNDIYIHFFSKSYIHLQINDDDFESFILTGTDADTGSELLHQYVG